MSGYVRLHRTLLGHPSFRNDAEAMAFAWLTVKAAWRASIVRYKEREIRLGRGQLALSVRDFAVAMDRDKGWVERLLKRLATRDMIQTDAKTGVLVISICNYERYQAGQDSDETPKKTRARQAQDTEQGREEGKKIVANATTRASRLGDDWSPAPLPANVAELVAQWPRGREKRELEGFRDYWTARKRDAARLDWDKTWHNRIRDQHDRIMKDNRNGQRQPADLRGSRPSPALDLYREGCAEEQAERDAQEANWGAWPSLPAIGSS